MPQTADEHEHGGDRGGFRRTGGGVDDSSRLGGCGTPSSPSSASGGMRWPRHAFENAGVADPPVS